MSYATGLGRVHLVWLTAFSSVLTLLSYKYISTQDYILAGYEMQPLEHIPKQIIPSEQPLEHMPRQIIPTEEPLEHVLKQIIASDEPLEHIPKQTITSEKPLEHIQKQIIASEEPLEHIQKQIIASEEPLEHIQKQIIASEEPLEHIPKQIITSEEPLEHIPKQIITSEEPLEHIQKQIIASEKPLEHIQKQTITSEEPLEHIPKQIIAREEPLEHMPKQVLDSEEPLENVPKQIIDSEELLENVPKQIIDSEGLVEHRSKQNPELEKLGNQIISRSGGDAKVIISKNQSALLLNVSHVKELELSSVVKQNSSRVVSVAPGNGPDVISFPVVYFNRIMMTGHHNELEPESTQCSRPHTFLIYVICTANERENRTQMRQTWLDIRHVTRLKHDGFHVERMFVVGGLVYEAPLVAEAVREESRLYGDILTIDYLQDHYVNVSRKVISAMFWINDRCDLSNVDYVMKADIDTLVNIYFIMSLAWNALQNNMPFDYICWYLRIKEVNRGGKYFEPWETYGERDWPRYCHGPAYTAHIGIFRMMLENITKIPILKNEDAMMTGVCVRNKTDLKVYSIPLNRIITKRRDWQYDRGRRHIIRTPHEMILAHELPPGEWKSAFCRMHNTDLMGHVRPRNTVIRS